MTDTALVTGAGRGIGREVARQLAAAGLHIVATARTAAVAEAVALEVRGTPLVLDVADPASIVSAAESVRELDVLVSNAAAYPDWQATALTVDLDDVELAWRTNVLGPWRLARAFAPALARSANARIVNVTSGSGSHGDPQFGLGAGAGMAPYAVTKAAANALTRKLAAALPGARVNAVDPGLTATAPGMEAMGARPVAEGAASVVWAAMLGPDGPTGGFFRDGRPHPW
ncbi:SDR family NAD(P)-dependent oxidoreductase [Nocardioides guangzhouensis]|uniref:SDR family NAD(P)-dependent oxidoreductase n=1 Tax=Nocardioides guangzhouensis TaxID=2497878 RepID=A0A4Q4ZKF2_9ACTN|nr:SDR family NAD(P)-dependent oxidoreductase [Nocardioides guangzhouensis]RYP88877.1 SDR family NAD(P)-dependent oxidoreductase [Nocardioides guangzhouensis]